jgi:flavin reductase (DIM6/NTAB) family NADH-FMN oxidoreductase RutF
MKTLVVLVTSKLFFILLLVINFKGKDFMKKEIDPFELEVKVNELWMNKWLLLTSGNYEQNDFNTMTVAWGSLGIMWNRPFAQAVVRPTRFTYEFIEKYDSFTLCSFPDKFRDALKLLGTKSGRDTDKITKSGLTPVKSVSIDSPSFEEADLVLECRKIYFDDFKPANFIDPEIDKNYPLKDYHRIYFGEIQKIFMSDF